MSNLKCLNCVHQKLCFNLIGGMNLQMKEKDCKDFLEINKDIWIAPCKRNDIVYVIDGLDVYPATVYCIDATLTPNNSISWSLKVEYIDEFKERHYLWGHIDYDLFRTKEEAEEELEKRKRIL